MNSSTAASASSSSKMIGSRSGLFWRGKYLEEGARAGEKNKGNKKRARRRAALTSALREREREIEVCVCAWVQPGVCDRGVCVCVCVCVSSLVFVCVYVRLLGGACLRACLRGNSDEDGRWQGGDGTWLRGEREREREMKGKCGEGRTSG